MDISQKLLEIWSWKFAHFLIHIWWTLLANFIEFWHGYLLNWHRMTSSYRFTLLFIVAVINRSNCGLRKWLYSLFPAGFSLSFTSCNRIQSGLLGSRSEIFLHYPTALWSLKHITQSRNWQKITLAVMLVQLVMYWHYCKCYFHH